MLALRLPFAVGLEQLAASGFWFEGAGLEVVAQDLGHQVGGVDQGFFGGLAHAGADFLHHGVEHEVTGQADKQRVDQENPQPQAASAVPRAVAVAEAAMGLDRFGVRRHADAVWLRTLLMWLSILRS